MMKQIHKERLLTLADRIENYKDKHLPELNMYYWFIDGGQDSDFIDIENHVKEGKPWCGTTACVAGHAAIMRLEAEPDSDFIQHVFLQSAMIPLTISEWLGLNYDQSWELFRTGWDADEKQAARTLRHLAKTEQVDWYIQQ